MEKCIDWCPACQGDGRTGDEPVCTTCNGLRLVVLERKDMPNKAVAAAV